MPDHRKHRGAGPNDVRWFSTRSLPVLVAAVHDLTWLLGRGYAEPSTLKLVGDRWGLTERQRLAVKRAACSDVARAGRLQRCTRFEELKGQVLWIDGFNLVLTIESAIGGGVLIRGRDGAIRDLASVHGSYRKVTETLPALQAIGEVLAQAQPDQVLWLLDKPVSNSGRLKSLIGELADAHGWNWSAELEFNPDVPLSRSAAVVATADSVILDRCARWTNLADAVIERQVPHAWMLDLGQPDREGLPPCGVVMP